MDLVVTVSPLRALCICYASVTWDVDDCTMDWIAFVPLAVSAVSLAMSMWGIYMVHRNRPHASFAVTSLDKPVGSDFLNELQPALTGTLHSDGDGRGYDLHMMGVHCVIRIHGEGFASSRPVIVGATPQSLAFDVWPLGGIGKLDNSAYMVLHWVRSPTRLRRCAAQRIDFIRSRQEPIRKHYRLSAWASRYLHWRAHRLYHRAPDLEVLSPTSPDGRSAQWFFPGHIEV